MLIIFSIMLTGNLYVGQIDAALEEGTGAVRNLVLNGFNHITTRFNLGQKYKYHKVWIFANQRIQTVSRD